MLVWNQQMQMKWLKLNCVIIPSLSLLLYLFLSVLCCLWNMPTNRRIPKRSWSSWSEIGVRACFWSVYLLIPLHSTPPTDLIKPPHHSALMSEQECRGASSFTSSLFKYLTLNLSYGSSAPSDLKLLKKNSTTRMRGMEEKEGLLK